MLQCFHLYTTDELQIQLSTDTYCELLRSKWKYPSHDYVSNRLNRSSNTSFLRHCTHFRITEVTTNLFSRNYFSFISLLVINCGKRYSLLLTFALRVVTLRLLEKNMLRVVTFPYYDSSLFFNLVRRRERCNETIRKYIIKNKKWIFKL